MEEQFVSFKTTLLAKEKGFDISTLTIFANEDEDCKYDPYKKGDVIISFPNESFTGIDKYSSVLEYHSYKNSSTITTAPTQSLLQKWLREKNNIDITIHRSFSMKNSYHYCLIRNNDYDNELQQEVRKDRKYEEALEEALYQALLLIK